MSKASRTPQEKVTITSITRREIFDQLSTKRVKWWGRLDELEFLKRVWDMDELPSTDSRYSDASGDMLQHRVYNNDWDDEWILSDPRMQLQDGNDRIFLRFLCEVIHPEVRSNKEEVGQLVQLFNQQLAPDGWRLIPEGEISGRPVFEARRTLEPMEASTALPLRHYQRLRDPHAFEEHLRRIDAGLSSDPAAAIGSSKEMVESTCKVILDDYSVAYTRKDDLMELYKKVADVLKLNAEAVPDSARGSQAAQGTLRALVTTVQRLTELRNELGLGHGRTTPSAAATRHARLAFTAASGVARFLLDTWHSRKPERASE
jgi:hypothetical protein